MVTIKLFGTMRLKTGYKSIDADVSDVRQACGFLAEKTGIEAKEFRKCVFAINGKPCKISAGLQDGDELSFFSPSGGG